MLLDTWCAAVPAADVPCHANSQPPTRYRRGRCDSHAAAEDGAGATAAVVLGPCSALISDFSAPQAKPWTCLLVGHDSSDVLSLEADRKRMLLERFQSEHPGFDFSDASLSGSATDASQFMR